MKKLSGSRRGQALTEYVLILCLVAITCIAGIRIFSRVICGYYSNITAVYTVPIP
jgi:Flp pilus assembly pilin Flp